MKSIRLNQSEAKLKTLRQGWLLFLVGLPITTALLLMTQPNLISDVERLLERTASDLTTPYRYRFFESLPSRGSPIAAIQQEIAFHQERIRRRPQDGLDRAALAIAYVKMARLTNEGSWYLLAEQTAQHSLNHLPFHNPEAVLVLAQVAEARHDFRGALQLAAQVPEQRDAIAIQATANLAMGNLAAANEAAETLVDRLPSLNSLTLLALAQAAQGQDQEARQTFDYALAAEEAGEISSSARTRTLLGRFYYERGQLERAEQLYREALRILPDYPPAFINLAQLEIRRGRYRAAERYYTQVADSSRGTLRTFDPLILRGRARIQQLQGNASAAEQLWDTAAAILRQGFIGNDASSFGHRRDLARVLLERGRSHDVAEALSLMQAEISDRRDAETQDTYAWALVQAGRWQEAQQVMQAVLKLGTRDAEVFERAGAIEQALGNPSQAATYFQQAREVDPTFDEAARHALGLGLGLGS
jgi:tetratricopeptide (TPR) repeat protein